MNSEEPVTVKMINLERIRLYMEKQSSVSKSQLARELGLSFPTIGRLVDELCASGELLEQGAGTSTGGRCACYYSLNPRFGLYLLVQIESHRIFWNLKDLQEEVVEQGEIPFLTLSLEKLDTLIADIRLRHPNLKAAAIGIAALVNHGVVEETHQYDSIKGMDLKSHFQNLAQVPVVVENDMNFLTMGCWRRRHPDAGSLVTFFLGGNGMGGGMVIGGRLWTGASGYCSEVSFLPFYEQYVEESCIKLSREDVCELYTRLIQTYAVTVNPHMVVLYHHPVLDGRIDDIRRRCAACIPAKAIPSIELSFHYQQDYEKGLFAVAQSLRRT